MPTIVNVSILIGIVIYFIMIIVLLRKRALMLKYTLVWLISGFLLLIMDVFPGFLSFLSHILGFTLPVNTLFTLAIFFMLIILMSLTSIVSKLNEKNRTLIQNFALRDKKIRELEVNVRMLLKKENLTDSAVDPSVDDIRP